MGKNNFDHLRLSLHKKCDSPCFIMSYSSGSASDPLFFPEQTPQHDEGKDSLNCFVLPSTVMKASPLVAVIYIAAFQSKFVRCQEAAGAILLA